MSSMNVNFIFYFIQMLIFNQDFRFEGFWLQERTEGLQRAVRGQSEDRPLMEKDNVIRFHQGDFGLRPTKALWQRLAKKKKSGRFRLHFQLHLSRLTESPLLMPSKGFRITLTPFHLKMPEKPQHPERCCCESPIAAAIALIPRRGRSLSSRKWSMSSSCLW